MLWLLDSGSSVSAVPEAVAVKQGWTGAGAADSLRGLDGRPIPSRRAAVPAVRLGSWNAPAVDFLAATFPVIVSLGLTGDTGILGQAFFRAVGEMEIDFERGVLRVR